MLIPILFSLFSPHLCLSVNAVNPHRGIVTLPSWKAQNSLFARSSSSSRHLSDEDCSEAPFLWNIRDNTNGDHVGFAFGTIHLPHDITTSDTAWNSILNALDDSCAVYGEINMVDPQTVAEVQSCNMEISSQNGVVTVSDFPDETLREDFSSAIDNMATSLSSEIIDPDRIVALFRSMSIFTLMETITVFNTPEYREAYFSAFFAGASPTALDSEILEQGRPSGGLEEVQTQCDIVASLNPTREDFINNFEEDWRPQLEQILNESLSEAIAKYRCGNLESIEELVQDEDFLMDEFSADERNIQMAIRIIEALKLSANRSFFAVGLAHWTIGNNSLEILLENAGYRLERVTDFYEADYLPDLTDATCNEQTDESTTNLEVPTAEPNTEE